MINVGGNSGGALNGQAVRGLSFNGRPFGIVSIAEFGAVGDGATDDTAAVQNCVNALQDGDTMYIPKGTYLVSQVVFTTRSNIVITGSGTILAKVDNTVNGCFKFTNYCSNVRIQNLKFKGLKGAVGAPTTYKPDTNSMVYIDDTCSFFIVENNLFENHLGHFIICGSSSGTFADRGHMIEKNRFVSMVDLGDNRQCAILLKPNAEYSNIMRNEFVDCKSAIHTFAANIRITDNNITSGSLDIVGAPTTLTDITAAKQGWVVCTSSGGNISKVQLLRNKMNHLTGSAPVIMCEGDFAKYETYYDISHNEILVNDSPYNIILKGNDGTKIFGNSMGKGNASIQTAHIALFQSKNIVIDKNLFAGECLTGVIEGGHFYEGKNIAKFKSTTTPFYQYNANGVVTNQRIPNSKSFQFMTIGGSITSIEGYNRVPWTQTKNGVGDYTITHNLGHAYYAITANANTNGGKKIFVRVYKGVNSFNLYIFDDTGTPQDDCVQGVLSLFEDREYNYTGSL